VRTLLALQKQKLLSRPLRCLDATENAERENAVLGMMGKGVFTLRSLRPLREKIDFLFCC